MLGDVDDVVGVHVEDRRADQRGGPGPEVLAVLIEHLHAVVLPVAHQDAPVPVDPHPVRQVELARARARLAPREQMRPVGGELVHARVAVAVGDEHLTRRRQGDVRGQVERAAAVRDAPVGRRAEVLGVHPGVGAMAAGTEGPQQLAVGGEEHHLPVIAVDQPEVVVGVGADRVRKREQPGAPAREVVAVAVEDDHGMVGSAVEAVDPIT